MSYRSDSALALTKVGVDALSKKLMSHDPRIPEVRNLLDDASFHYVDDASGSEVWMWEWLTWYPECKEISVLEELMSELDEENFYFIRIGEENDDTEIRGQFWDNPFQMELYRGINIDKPKSSKKGSVLWQPPKICFEKPPYSS